MDKYNTELNKDRTFGGEKEDENIALIRSTIDANLQKNSNFFNVIDFQSKGCYIELKSRRCKKTTYHDTMIGSNKIDFAKKSDKPTYFCFSFTDGLFCWKYDEEEAADAISYRDGGRNDRGVDETKPNYAYIKCEYLKKL
jgi:hypothetical protein